MKLYSTNNKENIVDLKTAVLNGLAEDEGLFMPTKIPKMKKEFFENIEKLSFQEIAFEVAKQLLSKDISAKKLKQIIELKRIPEEEATIAMHPDCPSFLVQLVIYPGEKRWLQVAKRSFIKK